jgi:hypothetical protein
MIFIPTNSILKILIAAFAICLLAACFGYRVDIGPKRFLFEPAQTQHIVYNKSDQVLYARQKEPGSEPGREDQDKNVSLVTAVAIFAETRSVPAYRKPHP